MSKVIIPGAFDPPTNGHIYLIERGVELFESVLVLIARNSQKTPLLTLEERLYLLKEIIAGKSWAAKVKVDSCAGLVAHYAKKHNYKALLRGLRTETDFSYELDIANINHSFYDSLDTLFLPTRTDKSIIRSSYVKELWSHGVVMEDFLPAVVAEKLTAKLREAADPSRIEGQ